MDFPYLSVITLSPFLAALIIAAVPRKQHLTIKLIAAVSTFISLLLSVVVAVKYYPQADGSFRFIEKLPWIKSFGISYHLGADGISIVLLMLTAVIIFCGVFASWHIEDRPKEFFVSLLVLVTGVFGVFVAVDMFLFFFYYELAVIPMFLLIGIWGSTRKDYASMKLVLYILVGSAFIMAGLLMIYFKAGLNSFDLFEVAKVSFPLAFQKITFVLLLIGFGILIPIWPFHTWSPDGHVAAPTATSMLHAGVLLKLGAYGILRVGFFLLPDAARFFAPYIAVLGVINIIYGALCAMAQRDLKYVIGYSSVSHMGYVLLGMATLNFFGLTGAVLQCFCHGIMTGLMFALVGFIYERAHTREIADFGGLWKKMPIIAGVFTLAGSASMGLPGTSGFVAELFVYIGAIFRFKGPYAILTIVALIGVVVTAAYIVRLLQNVFLKELDPKWKDLRDPRGIELAPFAILGGLILSVGLYPVPLINLMSSSVALIIKRVVGG